MLVLMLWGLNRAYEMTDRTMYAVLYERPYQYPSLSFTDFALLLHAFPTFSTNTILQLRIISLIQIVFSSALLAVGFVLWWERVYVENRLPNGIRIGAFCAAVAGGLFLGKLGSGYNGMASCLVISAAGLVFFASALKKKHATYLLALGSLFIGLTIFVKFTSALASMFAISLFVWFNHKNKKTAFISLMAGILGGIAVYFLLFRSIDSWLAGPFQATKEAFGSEHHQLMTVLMPQLKNALHAALRFIPATLATTGILLLWTKLYNQFSQSNKLTILVKTMGAILVPVGLVCGSSFTPHYFYAVIASLVIYLTVHRPSPTMNAQAISGLILLGLLPFAISFGTNYPDLLLHAFTSFACSWLLLFILCTLLRPCFLALMLITALSILTLPDFVHRYLFVPDVYDGIAPLVKQKETSSLPKLAGLRIEPSQKFFLEQSYSLLKRNNFQAGDKLFSPDGYLSPATLYAFDAVTPGLPCTYMILPENAKLLDRFLKTDRNPRFFITTFAANQNHMPPVIDAALTQNGIAFPSDFDYLGSVPNPIALPAGDTQYWRYPRTQTSR